MPHPPLPPWSKTATLHLGFLVGIAALAGCDGNRLMQAPAAPPDIREFVTGEAVLGLDSDGRFTFPAPPDGSGGPRISRERAGELAKGFLRSYGPVFIRAWEDPRERGGPIRLERLEMDPRVLYTETPYDYQRIPPEFHPASRRFYGPHYVVVFRDGPEPVLLIRVSVHNTGARIDDRGRYIPPLLSGGDIGAYPFPRDTARHRWIGPEEAVEQVGRRTGARITAVPERLNAGRYLLPSEWPWKLSLDRPLRVRSARGSRGMEVREVYLGARGQLLAPSENQPTVVHGAGSLPGANGTGRGTGSFEVPIRPGAVTEFEEVIVQEGGSEQ